MYVRCTTICRISFVLFKYVYVCMMVSKTVFEFAPSPPYF